MIKFYAHIPLFGGQNFITYCFEVQPPRELFQARYMGIMLTYTNDLKHYGDTIQISVAFAQKIGSSCFIYQAPGAKRLHRHVPFPK